MAASSSGLFEAWLSQELMLISPDIDLDVFVTYITGMLDTDDSDEEKKESIGELLSDCTEQDIQAHCDKIIAKWTEIKAKKDAESEEPSVEDKLASIMEKQKISVAVNKKQEISAEERARKDTILAQYSQVCDGAVTEAKEKTKHHDKQADGACGDTMLSRNMNASAVKQHEVDLREKSKLEHEQKKQRDKEEREKQRQKATERKEGEKKRTQKGERKR